MSRTWRRVAWTSAFLLVLLASAALLVLRDARNTLADPQYPASRVAFDAGELAWASGGSIRTSDGVINVGGDLDRWVISEAGVFFTTHEQLGGVAYFPDAPLYVTDGAGEPAFTGHAIDPESLNASPDGRYVSYVDTTSGPTTSGQPWTTTVIVDVRDHAVVVKQSASIKTSLTEDAVAYFSELEGETRGGAAFLEDDLALVAGPGFDDFVVDLVSVERTRRPESHGFTYPGSPTAPDEEHSFWTGDDGVAHVTESVSPTPGDTSPRGREVDLPIAPSADLLGWRSEDLLYGVDRHRLLACSVARATCRTYDVVVDESFSLASRLFAGGLDGYADAARTLPLD